MGVRPSFARPRVCLAAFVFVSAWTVVPIAQRPAERPRRVADLHDARCVLLADPRVHRSYIPPARRRASLSNVPGPQSNATVSVVYHGFTPEAQAAFQFAVDIWASQLNSSQTITIDAEFADLGPLVLASAGPGSIWIDVPGGLADTFYPSAVTNRLVGYDADETSADVYASFGSTFNWYYGTDGNTPFNKYDFVSVVLHELGHGLGFFGSGTVPAVGDGRWGFSFGGVRYPTIYDRFVINGAGQSILNTSLFPNPSAALTAQLTGDSLFFSGPHERAANGNAAARLYAPEEFKPGSSYSHLNETTYAPGNPNSLMTPFLANGEAIHDPGPITGGMFRDMGWELNSAPPPTCSYTVSGTPLSFTASGGTGTISITTGPTCSWSVQSFVSWLTFTSSTTGTGSGTVGFSVASTASSAARSTTIVAAGLPLVVNQAGVPCTFAASANLLTFSANGGSRTVPVTASASDCTFSTSSSSPWVTFSGSHTGSSTVTVIAAPSGAATRAATLNIAGTSVIARQNGHATPVFDINNDGAGDLLAYDPGTGSRFFAFGDPRTPGFNLGATSAYSVGWTIHAGDFNGDGRGDLFFYNSTSGRAYKGLSNGTEDLSYTEFNWSAGWQLTVADLNGDGLDDVFVYNVSSGRWYRCISLPNGLFNFSDPGLWSPNWSIYPGDFNGDGRDDLFLYNATNDANKGRTFRVLSNFDGSVSYVEGEFPWANNWTITPGDYNGDGRTDLFLYGPDGRWYRVFFNATSATFEAGAWSTGWGLHRGDFNADGRTDLFVYNETTGRWYVVISKANGTLEYFGDQVWAAGLKVSVTDVNVDGVADLVLYHPGDGRWFQGVTQSPGVFAFASGTWATGMQIHATRPQPR